MNQRGRALLLSGLLSFALCMPVFAVSGNAFSGHAQAVSDSISAPALTGGQLASMLKDYLDAQTCASSYPHADPASANYGDALRMVALGIFPADGSVSLSAPVTRGQVFCALAGAFQLEAAEQDTAALSGYPDMATASEDVRRAAAALLDAGVLQPAGTALSPDDSVTSGQVSDMLQRMISVKTTAAARPESAPAAVMLTDASVHLQRTVVPYPLMLSPSVRSATLQGVTLQKSLLLRGASMQTLLLDHTTGPLLTLAATDSEISLSSANGTAFSAIRIGDGSGSIRLSGQICSALEITGSGRTVNLSGMHLSSLALSGKNCSVIIDSSCTVDSLRVLAPASGCTLTVHGTLGTAEVAASQTTLCGDGHADKIRSTVIGNTLTLPSDTIELPSDTGLSGIQLHLSAPPVAPGGSLTANASFSGAVSEKQCALQWYLDGKPVDTYRNRQFMLHNGAASAFRYSLTFSYQMQLRHTVGLCILYQNQVTGKTEKLFGQASVNVSNYPDSHYAKEILALITPTYHANSADYTATQKAVFVNAKSYSSQTKFLIWVSLSAQKVNVFTGSQGKWNLLRVFDCASGRAPNPTPIGVTYVTYKQTAWITEDYQCRPIVRFYPGTGYAFHSRLYSPDGKTLIDDSIGAPASHGCIRMLDAGIYWLYQNIPLKTTVVIY